MNAIGIDEATIPFHRSIAGRMSLASALLALALIALVYAATRSSVIEHEHAVLQASVDTDVAGLADIYATGGRGELIQRMRDRIAFDSGDAHSYYLLMGADDEVIVGNLPQWPPLNARLSQIGEFEIGPGTRALGRATLLDENLRLLVGRDLRAQNILLSRLRHTFLLAGMVGIALALLTGYLLARRLRERLHAVSRLHQRIEHGEPSGDTPETDGRDEIALLSRQTQNTVARLTELLAAYRDVSEHAAHEIRTPLMHLDHRLVQTLSHTVDPRVQNELGSAREHVRSIIRMLESLLDISATRVRIGDTSGLDDIDLSALVAQLLELYQDSIEDQGSRLSSDIVPDIHMRADPMQMRRLLSNLLDNALKYCPAGCHIQFSLAPGPRLIVQDDGPGIAPADRERVFQKFSRVGGNGTQGHGLGLALARAIAERHGLQLRVADSPQGARFVMEPGV